MKRILPETICFFLLTLFLCLGGCKDQKGTEEIEEAEKYFVISGSTTNAGEVGDLIVGTGADGTEIAIAVDENGFFRDTLKITKGIYNLQHPFYRSFYALDSGELKMEIGEHGIGDVPFSGNGVEEAQLIQEFTNKRLDVEYPKFNLLWKGGLLKGESTYKETAKEVHEELTSFVEDKRDSIANIGFIEILKKDIDYMYLWTIKDFERRYKRESSDSTFRASKGFLSDLASLNLDDVDPTSYFTSEYYRKLVDSHWYDKSIKRMEATKGESLGKVYNELVSQHIKNEEVKNGMLLKANLEFITRANSKNDLHFIYNSFVECSTNEEHIDKITPMYQTALNMVKGSPSPKFYDYEDYSGGVASLDDFKGNLVYIDIWATWCGPCIREFPYLKKLKEKYDDKGITFMGISRDDVRFRDKWKEMIKKEGLKGVQLLGGSKDDDFIKKYQILTIPRFILLDREGKIIDSNAPNPSDWNKITQLLDRYIVSGA
ncbi:TlpA family protein disulfide reductase [Flagellimonas hymeniacidonis]|nr:TlpA disulfide reductase family protein [Flagellimonas hymeniacidonis]